MRLLDNRAPKPKILLCSSKTCLAIKTSPLQLTFESFHTGRLIHYTYEIFLHARQKYGQVKSQPDVLRDPDVSKRWKLGLSMETSVWIGSTQQMPLTLGVGGVRGKQDNKEPWQLYGTLNFLHGQLETGN